jgi:hypothetical protein
MAAVEDNTASATSNNAKPISTRKPIVSSGIADKLSLFKNNGNNDSNTNATGNKMVKSNKPTVSAQKASNPGKVTFNKKLFDDVTNNNKDEDGISSAPRSPFVGPPPNLFRKKAEDVEINKPESTAEHHERVKHKQLDTSINVSKPRLNEERRKRSTSKVNHLIDAAEEGRKKTVVLDVPNS